jgi:4-amino-4-deoxy-L-arabinose transferase-like glycosyltransferase
MTEVSALDTDPGEKSSYTHSVETRHQRLIRTRSESPVQRLRRLPRSLWLVVVLQGLLMVAMGVLYPTFQEPDEVAHVDYVIAHLHGDWFSGPGERLYQTGVLDANAEVPGTQFRIHVGGKPAFERDKRQSFDERGTATAVDRSPNQMVQHPPLYYGLAAGYTYLIPNFSDRASDVQVFWLRFLSMLLLLPVPVLAFLIGRRLTGDDTVALVMAILPLSMPVFLRTGASVTNDSLAILLGTALLYGLSRVVSGDLTRRTAVLIGLLWGAGLLTKAFALVMPPVIILMYLIAGRGTLVARIKSGWQPTAIAGLTGFLVGGWWWIRNVLVYDVVQPNGLGSEWGSLNKVFGPDHAGGTEFGFFQNYFRLFGARLWGSLGLIDVPSMRFNAAAIVAVLFLLLVIGGVTAGLRYSSTPRWAAVAFVLPLLLTMALTYMGARGVYLRTLKLPGIQMRYVLPVLPGLTVSAAVALRRIFGRGARWLPVGVLLFALVFDAIAALVVLDIEMGPRVPEMLHRIWGGFKFVLGWAPWPGPITVSLIALTGVVALVTLGSVVSDARRVRPDQPVSSLN